MQNLRHPLNFKFFPFSSKKVCIIVLNICTVNDSKCIFWLILAAVLHNIHFTNVLAVIWGTKCFKIYVASMHSSRMRTARMLTVLSSGGFRTSLARCAYLQLWGGSASICDALPRCTPWMHPTLDKPHPNALPWKHTKRRPMLPLKSMVISFFSHMG